MKLIKLSDKGLEGYNKKEEPNKNKTEEKTPGKNAELNNNSNRPPQDDGAQKKLNLWSKYDFVAGDKVIFEDNLSGEENGEFPSRWDLKSGTAEVAILGEDRCYPFFQQKYYCNAFDG